MGQNTFEELSAPQSIGEVSSQQHGQRYRSTSWNGSQSQWEYLVNEVAPSIWWSFPFAVDHAPPRKHIPEEFRALGESHHIQPAM